MANNSINNTIGSATSATTLKQIRNSSGQWVDYNDQTDQFGFYNNAGSPEGVVTANTGSICTDTSTGNLYTKSTDSSNTDWNQLSYISGNRTFIQSQTASNSATLDFTTGFSSAFSGYAFEFFQIMPVTANQIFSMQMSLNGGSSWLTTPYMYSIRGIDESGNVTSSLGNNTGPYASLVPTGLPNMFAPGLSGELRLWGFSQTGSMKGNIIANSNAPNTGWVNVWGIIGNNGGGIGNAVRFLFNSGNIAHGVISLYGIN